MMGKTNRKSKYSPLGFAIAAGLGITSVSESRASADNPTPSPEARSAIWVDKHEKRALAGWASLAKSVASCSGEGITKATNNPKGVSSTQPIKAAESEERRRFWAGDQGGKVLFDLTIGGVPKKTTAFGVNQDYAFVAERAGSNDVFFLKRCGRQPVTKSRGRADVDLYGLLPIKAPFTIESDTRPLADLLAAQGTFVSDCIERDDGASKKLEIKVSFLPIGDAAKDEPGALRATVLLDPGHDYRVLKSRTEGATFASDREVEYSSTAATDKRAVGPGGMIGFHFRDVEPRFEITKDFKISSFSTTPVSNEEFFLPSLGLPHCPEEHPPASRRIIFVGIAFILIGIALGVAYRYRKSPPRGSAANT